MRPMLSAVVVALVLLTAAFVSIAPTLERSASTPAASSTGLRAAVVPNYEVLLDIATEPVLPGYHDTLYYEVLNDTYGAPVQTLSTITILGTYYNTGLHLLKMPGTPVNVTTAPINTWSFLVPANATANTAFPPVLTVWANSTSMHMNESSSVEIEIGSLTVAGSACDVTGPCGTLVVGNPATISVNAEARDGFGDESPAYNESVKILFYSTGSSPVPVPGVPTTLTTDAQGHAALTFTPSSTIFNVPGPNHVEIEVTDFVNTSLTVYDNITWTLLNPAGTVNWAFYLNEVEYYSGQTVTASWQWAGTNSTVGTINVTNYIAYDVSTDNLIANGLVSSTSPTGSFSFALPADYVGDFEVVAFAHNSSQPWTFDAEAYSYAAILVVLPSEFYFNPGDTIGVAVTPEGPALAGASLAAFVQATNSGQTLFNSTLTGTTFQFTVPAIAPAGEYRIVVWAFTATQGTLATTDEYVEENSGYTLWAGVGTVSSYADGSFAPGQAIQVNYKITAYGTSPQPTLMEVAIYPGGCEFICDSGPLKYWFVTGSSGSVSFTIPSNTANGMQTYIVLAEFENGEGFAPLTVNVNSAPSALNYELGAGSGLTVGWLILLILIIVIVLVVMMMRRRGKPTMVMSPAASTSSAPEWKEQPGSSGGQTGGSSDTSAGAPPGAQ
jgi:hypothetical protein